MKIRKELIDYYKDKGLLIVGQGINPTQYSFRKNLLIHLKDSLTSEDLTPQVINNFSLLLNKTEMIDILLKNNPSIEEIKILQVYDTINTIRKIMRDYGLPLFLDNIGNLYRFLNKPEENDRLTHISTAIKECPEPTIIYSSGPNDIKRAISIDTSNIKKIPDDGLGRLKQLYIQEKAKNPETLIKVIDAIKRNFETIYGINLNSDIYALGADIPKLYKKEEMRILKELIIAYNEELKELCKEYGVVFIDPIQATHRYSSYSFHSHQLASNLANEILISMYKKKINMTPPQKEIKVKETQITNAGIDGMIQAIDSIIEAYYNEYLKKYALSETHDTYSGIRILEIVEDYQNIINALEQTKTEIKKRELKR